MDQTLAISERDEDIIDKLMAEMDKTLVEGALGADGGTTPPSQVNVRASIMNNGVGTMLYFDSNIWSGSTIGDFSSEIDLDKSGPSSHRGVPPGDVDGSSGAVIYYGSKVQGGDNDSAWVMAWSVPGNGTANKIYVEFGPVSKYTAKDMNTVWKTIQDNLNKFGSSTKCHPKADHGVEASAAIDTSTGNSAKVAAVFFVNIDG